MFSDYEISCHEARHGKAFEGLPERYLKWDFSKRIRLRPVRNAGKRTAPIRNTFGQNLTGTMGKKSGKLRYHCDSCGYEKAY